MAKCYINRRGNGYLETVSEYEDRKQARIELKEYQLSDNQGTYYISQRACKDWN